ncbi:MAG TPA: hypothetical protein VJ739_09425 [Gemmataceae bacterium]|nr:hypothetical protein [Gemmataceae bacterium]
MADTNRPPEQAKQSEPSSGHVRQTKERVIEEGRPENNDPRPSREELSGTPIGSDPRE